ncbi:hypothetical protein Pelo_13237 [Pelomyxa schiedti]|nr:hypothetical protein Pelo_13237 [Pelomyxa schiedti]
MYEYGGISWRITLKGYACLYTFFIVFSVIILAPFEAYKPTDTVRLTPFWREPSFKRLLSKVVILHEKQVNFSELHESVEMESRDSPEPKPLNTPIKLSPAEFMKAYIKRIMNVNFFLGIFWALPASIILYYYIGTVHLHLAQLIEDFSTYVMIFMGVATASAIIMAPLYGKFIAKFGLLRGLVTNTTVGLLWCSLVCIPVLQVQIASFVVFGCFRVMLSTSWATYVVETFGSQHFGQLCGIGWFIFAMSNQVQLLLVKLVVSITGGQFLYIDIGVGCASALSYIACFVMWKRHKKPTTDPTTTADQPTDTPPAEA